MSQNGARGSVCISSFTSSVDTDLQSFFNKYFVDTDSDDDDVEFEGSTPGDIRGRPVYLIKSCRDRQISESDSHRDIVLSSVIDIGLPTGLTIDTIHSPPGIGISEGPTCVTIIHFTSLDKVREKNKTASVRGFFYGLTNLNKPPCMAGSPSTLCQSRCEKQLA